MLENTPVYHDHQQAVSEDNLQELTCGNEESKSPKLDAFPAVLTLDNASAASTSTIDSWEDTALNDLTGEENKVEYRKVILKELPLKTGLTAHSLGAHEGKTGLDLEQIHKHLEPPTAIQRGRGHTTVNSVETGASGGEFEGQRVPLSKIASRQRTLSSPPALRRSKSTPRPLHIPTSGYSKPANTAQPHIPRRNGNAVLPDRPIRSALEPELDARLTPQTAAEPSSRISLDREISRKHSVPFTGLPIQTYLHLALASPETPSTSVLGPAPTLEMKYPYVPSDCPDLILERITNFFFLPPYLEKVLLFGTLECLDSWLYTFTILPLRFGRALGLLIGYWISFATSFWKGGNRLQKRTPRESESEHSNAAASIVSTPTRRRDRERLRRREREKRISALQPQHKADLLKGAVVILSCFVLMRFDASRMYHAIRGQSAIKLYVIYNVLEVGDRLLSALGQDIFECLFSKETLERKADGRSKVWRPFWCFLLAGAYNIIHSTCLFYQMVTLNVAVNSYSNALLTLLLSSQFVEIKSTVFKRFEKENIFQMTCADIVERFQLWLMLSIIVSRNLVEVGVRSSSEIFSSPLPSGEVFNGSHNPSSSGGMVTPRSFMILPSWAGQIFGPFLMVLGSETLVDWLKHAYITKFNQIRPNVYERFLDVLCRDYYSYAFGDQNLTRRFGLPVIPLACLFIRASLQTYHMFLATHAPSPLPSATSTALGSAYKVTTSSSPAAAAALGKFDTLIRRALGQSGGYHSYDDGTSAGARLADKVIAATTLVVFCLGVFLLFLGVKLVLGMAMVGYARGRYKHMKEREKEDILTGGRRVGGFGLVEVDENKRKHIFGDDKEGADRVRAYEVKGREKEVEGALGIGKGGGVKLDDVERYSMVAKRIW